MIKTLNGFEILCRGYRELPVFVIVLNATCSEFVSGVCDFLSRGCYAFNNFSHTLVKAPLTPACLYVILSRRSSDCRCQTCLECAACYSSCFR